VSTIESNYLLDTSALLTLIEDEDGAGRVERILKRSNTFIPFIALMEVYYISLQESDQATADLRHATLTHSDATVLWEMDEATLLTAARLKASHRISLAGALIAAFAVRKNATLIHKDPEYESLTNDVRLEALPYKTT
jgi:predicted nucleic acid-binding protein